MKKNIWVVKIYVTSTIFKKYLNKWRAAAGTPKNVQNFDRNREDDFQNMWGTLTQ